MASWTVRIFSASSSGISISKASSKAMTSSTVSSESAPRSSTNEALGVTSPSSTPSCSTMICFTFSSTAAMLLLALVESSCCLNGSELPGQMEILTAAVCCGQTALATYPKLSYRGGEQSETTGNLRQARGRLCCSASISRFLVAFAPGHDIEDLRGNSAENL